MSSRPENPSPFLLPSTPPRDAAGEEESGIRGAKSAEQRERDARGIQKQLQTEGQALMRGLEALRFAFNGRTGPQVRSLKGRAQALAHVRDGFLQVLGASADLPRLFRDDSAFVEYLRGIAAFAHATLEVLGDHARQGTDAGVFAVQVELAKNLHFDELTCEVDRELDRAGLYDPAVDAVRAAMERLFYVASALEKLV